MLDLLSLSFLPPSCWRDAVGDLRAGVPPAAVLVEQCARRVSRRCRRIAGPDELRERAHKAAALGARAGLTAIPLGHPDYPVLLETIHDPPFLIWVRGSVAELARPSVAIVGSRAGSPYALAVAARLAEDLAAAGYAIVSGLARGVDAAAHQGALRGGRTIAVLGCGANRMYPREHSALAAEIAAAGAVVSELAPGTPPTAIFFPLRNRIISGLSQAVVVIEAGDRSGSLITARCALEQGREVMAVPGNVLTDRNRGGHALLRDGARLVERAADVIEELCGLPLAPPAQVTESQKVDDHVLGQLVAGEPCDLDELAIRTAWPVNRILPRLLELEIEGRLKRVGGGRFVRV